MICLSEITLLVLYALGMVVGSAVTYWVLTSKKGKEIIKHITTWTKDIL